MRTYDVIIAGGGPAGAACGAFCAQSGLSTLILEKVTFPRDKVCGDCLNPSCWPLLERLDLASRVLSLPHSKLEEIEFIGVRGRSICFPLNASKRGEIAVKRAHLDNLLLQRALECGAEVRENAAITSIERGWRVHAAEKTFGARVLVAADGRNSTIARSLSLLPAAKKDRIALQTHVPAPPGFGERVILRLLPEGYCGAASIGDGEVNLCLVSRPKRIASLKAWAEANFAVAASTAWRTITPLSRAPISPAYENLFLCGDAARVVEPFTGEGIFYALASGELAARHIRAGSSPGDYAREHARLYRGRLWVNALAKRAVLYPRAGSLLLDLLRFYPPALRFLTAKVVGDALR
ncbi:MAG: hypothetical protein QOD99_1148 [Chthoniobacter sp.]|nr:hypothetical protein [Chthoniobacter sp.]